MSGHIVFIELAPYSRLKFLFNSNIQDELTFSYVFACQCAARNRGWDFLTIVHMHGDFSDLLSLWIGAFQECSLSVSVKVQVNSSSVITQL